MTDTLEVLPQTGPVAIWRFVTSAVATPLLLGVGGIVFIVPAFAAYYGFWAYLLLGLPLFRLAIKWCPDAMARRDASPFVVAGSIANLGTYPLYFLFASLSGASVVEASDWAMFCAAFGLVFGPLHGLVFGWLYMVATPRNDAQSGRSGLFDAFVLS